MVRSRSPFQRWMNPVNEFDCVEKSSNEMIPGARGDQLHAAKSVSAFAASRKPRERFDRWISVSDGSMSAFKYTAGAGASAVPNGKSLGIFVRMSISPASARDYRSIATQKGAAGNRRRT